MPALWRGRLRGAARPVLQAGRRPRRFGDRPVSRAQIPLPGQGKIPAPQGADLQRAAGLARSAAAVVLGAHAPDRPFRLLRAIHFRSAGRPRPSRPQRLRGSADGRGRPLPHPRALRRGQPPFGRELRNERGPGAPPPQAPQTISSGFPAAVRQRAARAHGPFAGALAQPSRLPSSAL